MYVSFSGFLPPPPHFQASSQASVSLHLRDFRSTESSKYVCLGEGDLVM